MVLENLLDKIKSGVIKKIVVVEKEQFVIDLIAPYFKNKKIEIIQYDIFDYVPIQQFDCIYFDIWPSISEDNLEEIKKLHNKFKNRLNRENPNAWMNSWMKEHLQKEKRRESRQSNRFYRTFLVI